MRTDAHMIMQILSLQTTMDMGMHVGVDTITDMATAMGIGNTNIHMTKAIANTGVITMPKLLSLPTIMGMDTSVDTRTEMSMITDIVTAMVVAMVLNLTQKNQRN